MREARFSRFYVCFGALKRGFKAGCRPTIRIDGCHLKGPHGCILLTAIGVNPNNNLFPIAYAVVDKECRETCSDHKYCVGHLHNNFKLAGFRGLAYKNALWNAARACTISEWKMRMNEMKKLSEAAHDWLNDKPATQWSRSHLKWIREYLMRKMQDNRYSVETYKKVYAPAIQPMSHEGMWSESCIIPPLPPNFGRGAGRFKKARRRESDEPTLKKKKKSKTPQLQKLIRNQKTVHCNICGEHGHNTAKCPKKVTNEAQQDQAGHQVGHTHKGQHETVKKRAGKRKATKPAIEGLEHATNITEDEQPEACLTQDQIATSSCTHSTSTHTCSQRECTKLSSLREFFEVFFHITGGAINTLFFTWGVLNAFNITGGP
ncbi:UNVERIFIED_CONTAM: hypothetical protein Slati_1758400 [Sesamum latifolium]|uniref:CCHC-type domain-containing protein n=1 Tax=Sesamum latifolium TaxID=2727402 RepID=A0AAW2WXA4_9LAMI